jgi:Zn-dependent peptidase ImmA (M78 family)/DNA-binding XRE family transcriptional regulator
MTQRSTLGLRIKEARERLGLTQEELARRVGLAHKQTVSEIERGGREVKAVELVRFARVLYMDLSDMVVGSDAPAAPRVVWRAAGGVSREAEARFLQKCRDFRLVEDLMAYEPPAEIWRERFDPADRPYDRAGKMAREAHTRMELGSRPASALPDVLESRFGVKVWYEPLAEQGSSACSVAEFGPAMLMDATEAPWRRNFNFAHELFHLLAWDYTVQVTDSGTPDEQQAMESYANTFAAELLLPCEDLRSDVKERCDEQGQVSDGNLVQLARSYQVSTSALLWRLVNIGLTERTATERLLSDPGFRAMDKAGMPGAWWNPKPYPERMVLLGFFACQEGHLSWARLAQMLDVDLVNLPQRLAEYGLSEEENYDEAVRTT